MAFSETETVVKRILPYLRRRGYDETVDFSYETGVELTERYGKGYVDILVTCGRARPLFLVEAKRISRKIVQKDEKQALAYGRAKKVPFVVVTNGKEVRCLNTTTGAPILWNGNLQGRVPTRAQLKGVIDYMRRHPDESDVPVGGDASLPFRPGLPLRQLNSLFAKCHKWIRNIEKHEDDSFADFSKILFLKLLEEKAEYEGLTLPYSYHFYELAAYEDARADQVKHSIEQMIAIQRQQYGDVLSDPLKLNQAPTYLKIVRALAEVSFTDSETDVKGAAFEYFVRATLKGKRLGQYFTPRPLVRFMVALVGRDLVTNALRAATPIQVVDPACGTGGFLVYMLRDAVASIESDFRDRKITARTRDELIGKLKRDVFYGADANEGVASAAKMNMIIAGDGHANIWAEDALRVAAKIWATPASIDLVLTNPPFGTSESDSLGERDLESYSVETTKGQLLFLQRMLSQTAPGGLICTVIDEGVLNTDTAKGVRSAVLEHAYLRAIVRLPDETFKPNKINVRVAVLLLEKRASSDPDFSEDYPVRFFEIKSLGYEGSGSSIRDFHFDRLIKEIEAEMRVAPRTKSGYGWSSFSVRSSDIAADGTRRFDFKYWHLPTRKRLAKEIAKGGIPISQLNQMGQTLRGKSPAADAYVDGTDGYARVLKAGSSITSLGKIAPEGPLSDFVEKDEYDKLPDTCKVKRNDVLLSSTGTGTLGKAAVYESGKPAIADGHVTIIRVDPVAVSPRYLADYLRAGFGRTQIERLYTGSTGLIELTPQQVDAVIVDLPSLAEQKQVSTELRSKETKAEAALQKARARLNEAREAFQSI
ncbi:MAG TPA: N-6 DNA methylase [Solirubrobacteraceae bacterium]